jgi:hypothetical protein
MGDKYFINYHFANATHTMDGTASCLVGSATFTSREYKIGDKENIELYLTATNITTAVSGYYEVSPDGSTWFTGAATITAMDNNQQVVPLAETAVGYIRLILPNTNAGGATVKAFLCGK